MGRVSKFRTTWPSDYPGQSEHKPRSHFLCGGAKYPQGDERSENLYVGEKAIFQMCNL